MTLDGEITEITSPPNKADRFRGITIWVPATEEHTEITLPVEDFKKAGLAEGGDRRPHRVQLQLQVQSANLSESCSSARHHKSVRGFLDRCTWLGCSCSPGHPNGQLCL